MRYIWHSILKAYLQIGFFFYFKKINIFGREHIPKNKGVLYVGNHQNSLIDPLLIATTRKKEAYYLTRAQAFTKPLVSKFLHSINMLPIYRIRDGFENLSKNEEVFKKCYDILENKEAVLIFPEGNHNIQRRIRYITKGFTRIVFGTIEKNPNNKVDIIPIGLNYTDPTTYGSCVNIFYGKPIPVNEYWEKYDKVESVTKLKDEISKQLKLLTTHIEDADKHDEIVTYFDKNEFLNPKKTNKKLENLENYSPKKPPQKKGFDLIYTLFKINSFLPLSVWRYVKPKIDEVEFISTFKYVLGITVFPLFYILQSIIIGLIFNYKIGLLYLVLSVLLVFIHTRTKQ